MAIRVLDNFHKKSVSDFKAPFEDKGPQSFLQIPIDLDLMNPRYVKNMKNFFNTQYTAQIAVGTNKNVFSFILDTGSGTSLLASQSCQSSGCKTRHRFNQFTSETWRSQKKIVRIGYAKGSVVIELGSDNFWFGDF